MKPSMMIVAVIGATVVLTTAGCGTSSTPTAATSATVGNSSPAPGTASARAPTTTSAVAVTRKPCELLTASIAKTFAGDDAQKQSLLDSNPPLPVGPTECFYTGSNGSVFFSIDPIPNDPEAPVNHFHVLRPENEIPNLGYRAYWFAAGESVYVVQREDLLNFKVRDPAETAQPRDFEALKAAAVDLANQIVPRVG
jgi:hypothetical protein